MTLALILYLIGFAATATSPLEDGWMFDKPVWLTLAVAVAWPPPKAVEGCAARGRIAGMNALAPEDKIAHSHAVWRDERPPEGTPGSLPVSVDYGGAAIICTLVCQAGWEAVKRWRFGWPA